MVLQHSSVGKSLLWQIIQCQSTDFPTKLCCNTIIHLSFHYFLFHRSLLHLYNLKKKSSLFSFCYSTAGIVTVVLEHHACMTVVLEYLESDKGCAAR